MFVARNQPQSLEFFAYHKPSINHSEIGDVETTNWLLAFFPQRLASPKVVPQDLDRCETMVETSPGSSGLPGPVPSSRVKRCHNLYMWGVFFPKRTFFRWCSFWKSSFYCCEVNLLNNISKITYVLLINTYKYHLVLQHSYPPILKQIM